MSCSSCAKGFSLLRQEKSCPGCGFSYCSKCINNKLFLPKLNAEAKVCGKCRIADQNKKPDAAIPPDAYFKRLASSNITPARSNTNPISKDDEIKMRLDKLKQDIVAKESSDTEIASKLQNLKGATPSTSDAELYSRLAKLRGVPEIPTQSKSVLLDRDLRTEQEQADDLLKQYLEQTNIDTKYKDEFDSVIEGINSRVQKLKGNTTPMSTEPASNNQPETAAESDEEESVEKIVEKLKTEALLENEEIAPSTNDELPFCEICNEDAIMRCLGCRYLFCKHCYLDHKDDDDGCNKYELYQPPKGSSY